VRRVDRVGLLRWLATSMLSRSGARFATRSGALGPIFALTNANPLRVKVPLDSAHETTLDLKRQNEFGDRKCMNQDGPVTTRRKIRFTDLLRCRSATRRVDATRSTFICRRTKNVTVHPSAVTQLYLGSTYVYPSSMKESVRGST